MELILSAMKNTWRKRMRSALTIGGIAVGVMSVVIITIIGDVGKQLVNAELDSMGISGVSLRIPSEYKTGFDAESLELVQEDLNVEEATPLLSKIMNISIRGNSGQAVVWGVSGNAQRIISMDLLYGRLIQSSDVSSSQKVCVVDESFAEKQYGRSNIVGKTVRVFIENQYVAFEIVGVVSSGGNLMQSVMGEVVPTFMYVPYTTLVKYMNSVGFTQIVARISEAENEDAAAQAIAAKLNSDFGVEDGVKYENLNKQKEKLNSVMNIVTAVLSIIGGISLLIAGLSIMTVMLMTVSERTREIGIKKSIGASGGMILFEFLIEALFLSLIGGVIGAAAGIAACVLGGAAMGIRVVIKISAILLCIAFAMGIGTAFGVYPAQKAARLKPVDALRSE